MHTKPPVYKEHVIRLAKGRYDHWVDSAVSQFEKWKLVGVGQEQGDSDLWVSQEQGKAGNEKIIFSIGNRAWKADTHYREGLPTWINPVFTAFSKQLWEQRMWGFRSAATFSMSQVGLNFRGHRKTGISRPTSYWVWLFFFELTLGSGFAMHYCIHGLRSVWMAASFGMLITDHNMEHLPWVLHTFHFLL